MAGYGQGEWTQASLALQNWRQTCEGKERDSPVRPPVLLSQSCLGLLGIVTVKEGGLQVALHFACTFITETGKIQNTKRAGLTLHLSPQISTLPPNLRTESCREETGRPPSAAWPWVQSSPALLPPSWHLLFPTLAAATSLGPGAQTLTCTGALGALEMRQSHICCSCSSAPSLLPLCSLSAL